MKKSYAPFTALILCLGMAMPALAADTALIDRIKSRYEQTNSFSANFEQNLTHKESGATEKRQGRILFRKPFQIRWQTSSPEKELLVVTDKEIWDYLPDEKLAYRYSPELLRDSRGIVQVLTGSAALNRDFDVRNAGSENGLTKLKLLPNEPVPQMIEAMIWVEPETGFIKRAALTDFYGNTNDVKLTGFRPDAGTNAADFKFAPPAGTEVEDRIDRNVPERELFK